MALTRVTYSKESTRKNRREVNARSEWFQKEPVSIRKRVAYAALTLMLLLTIGYASLFYSASHFNPVPVPAHMTTANMIDGTPQAQKTSLAFKLQSIFIKKTFIKEGQALSVHYRLPKDAILDLHIRQCKRMFVLEVYSCIPKSQQTVRIEDKTSGWRSLQFSEPGFYHFSETVILPDDSSEYSIAWVRNKKPASEEAGS